MRRKVLNKSLQVPGAVWLAALTITTCVGALAPAAPAFASWGTSGSGHAAGASATMPSGATPTGTAGLGTVTLTWTAVTLSDGAPVGGYVITRYTVNGVAQAVNASCSGVIATTTCTERTVPAGTWVYTDTPVVGNWTGGASPMSAPITVP